jgi:hypothetical protein
VPRAPSIALLTLLGLSLGVSAAALLGVVALLVGRGDVTRLIAVLTLGSVNLYVVLLLTRGTARRPPA